MDERAAWDRFWSYDRQASFGTGKGAGNYAGPIAEGWRAFFATLPDGARVLDVATGNGAIALLAIEAGRRLQVTGVDLADVRPAAFVTARTRELKAIRFLGNTPAETLPLAEDSFDAVVSQYGIEYSDLERSVPEAVRVLAPGGRLRFVTHAAEGSIAALAIADADFLIDELDLTGRAARCFEAVLAVERGHQSGKLAEIAAQARYGQFRDGLKALSDRLPAARDQAMLVSVHQALTELFKQRRALGLQALLPRLDALAEEIAAHRTRQRALIAAALSARQVAALGKTLGKLGLADVTVAEQRDGDALVGHVLEAGKP
jgi:SAM-dependent methyltransferase